MIVTICPVEPFGDPGVMLNWDGKAVVYFDGESAARDIGALVREPDDRLRVREEPTNPVYAKVLNGLLGTEYKEWGQRVPAGFFGPDNLTGRQG